MVAILIAVRMTKRMSKNGMDVLEMWTDFESRPKKYHVFWKTPNK